MTCVSFLEYLRVLCLHLASLDHHTHHVHCLDISLNNRSSTSPSHLCNRSLRTLVGEVHSLAFEAVGRAENNSVVVLDDGEVLKGVVGYPDRLTIFLKVCADFNIEFELHSTAERSRWILIDSQNWQNSQAASARIEKK